MLNLTKTDVAKYAAHIAVSSYAAKAVKMIVSDNTNVDPDGIPVKIGSLVAGEIVAQQARPYTDAIVEKAVAWYQDRKASKAITN